MMLSIFSCAYWPGVYLLWRTVCSDPLPILSCWVFFVVVLFFWSFWVIGIYPEAFNIRWTGDSVANLPYLMTPLCGQRNDQIFSLQMRLVLGLLSWVWVWWLPSGRSSVPWTWPFTDTAQGWEKVLTRHRRRSYLPCQLKPLVFLFSKQTSVVLKPSTRVLSLGRKSLWMSINSAAQRHKVLSLL